jgi:hypothetical protein
MATQSPKAEKAPKSGKKGAQKKKAKGGAAGLEAEPKAREGTPRFQTHYESVVRERLAKEFGLDNPMQVPRLENQSGPASRSAGRACTSFSTGS